MTKIYQLTEKALKDVPETRNSDNRLILEVIKGLGFWPSAHQERIILDTNFGSITRAARKLRAEGKYLPDPEVQKMKNHKEQAIQQRAPSLKADKLQELVATNATLL